MTRFAGQRTCPICGQVPMDILFYQRLVLPEELPLDAKQTIVCCDQCGFVYTVVTSPQKDYDRFYSCFSKYADAQTYMGGGTEADVNRQQQTATYITRLMPDKHNRIMDIGCANGTLLGILKQLGYNHLYGIDPSPDCIQNVKRLYDIEAYSTSLTNLPCGSGQFDLVVLSHVLEHVRDVQLAMQQIFDLLTPSGYLYLEVPDASRYADFMFSPMQEFNLEHINHFSQVCLERLLSTWGFRMVDSGQKLVESGPKIFTPAISATAVKEAITPPGTTDSLPKDELLRSRIQSYIEISQQMLTRIDLNLQRILAEHPRIIVWGTGQLVMKLLSETVLSKAAITAFVDSNPVLQGQSLNGTPILAPMQIVDQPDPIVVSSTLYFEEIRSFIVEEMKLTNLVVGLI